MFAIGHFKACILFLGRYHFGYILFHYLSTDGIITGGSSLKHINDNLDAFNDGPLSPSKYSFEYQSVVRWCTQV